MENWWQQASRSLDMVSKPFDFFQELADGEDLRPGIAALAVTSLLFCSATLTAHWVGIPMSEPAIVDLPGYRIYQAFATPLLLAIGWLTCSLAAWGISRLLRSHGSLRRILAVTAPALFLPLWLVFWPTEMAKALNVFTLESPGFAGLWVRELMPAVSFIYILGSLSLAYWQALRLLLREAFLVAFFSCLPALGWWALVFR